jgi:hypothetical protein
MTDSERAAVEYGKLIKPQLAQYNRRMADAAPYRNSPRWERLRESAMDEFHASTVDAVKWYVLAMQDMEVLGEITESTWYAWQEEMTRQTMQEVA